MASKVIIRVALCCRKFESEEKMLKKAMGLKRALLVGLIMLVSLSGCGNSPTEQDNERTDVSEEKSSDNKETLKTQETTFLIDQYLSEEEVMGSATPKGYVFMEDGTFAYYGGEYSPTEQGEVLDMTGTWQIEEDILVLNLKQKEIADGGRIVDDEIEGQILCDYNVEKQLVSDTVEYKIKSIEEDKINLEFDGKEISFYKLGVQKGYIEFMKAVAKQGFKGNLTVKEFIE